MNHDQLKLHFLNRVGVRVVSRDLLCSVTLLSRCRWTCDSILWNRLAGWKQTRTRKLNRKHAKQTFLNNNHFHCMVCEWVWCAVYVVCTYFQCVWIELFSVYILSHQLFNYSSLLLDSLDKPTRNCVSLKPSKKSGIFSVDSVVKIVFLVVLYSRKNDCFRISTWNWKNDNGIYWMDVINQNVIYFWSSHFW